MPTPQTLIQAVRYYADPDVCHALMVKAKWTNGRIECPTCGSRKIGEIRSRRMFQCKECRKQFSAKVGTIFEDSPLPLDKWFVAVWCAANCKNGISSYELGRAIGVTQKTAWFMLHRIREAMKTGTFRKLTGTVEADETFVGGKAANMHAKRRKKAITGRGAVNKTVVQGVLERNGEVRAQRVPNTEGPTLRGTLAENVEPGATVYTDAHGGYSRLFMRYVHSTVDHAKEYVRGAVHINGMENFWSLLKRAIKGTYIHIEAFHVDRYCDEQAFRYNNRENNDGGRFWMALQGVVGKRLTYRRLCAIGDSGFMGIE